MNLLGQENRRCDGMIPIIALTAHVINGEMELLRDSGMNGYASKPIDMDRPLDVSEAIRTG